MLSRLYCPPEWGRRLLGLLMICGAMLAASAAELPVLDGAASAAHLETARAGQSVVLRDLAAKDADTVQTATQRLKPGTYRLHVLVAASPVHGLATSALELRLGAGSGVRQYPLQLLPAADEWVALSLPFEADGETTLSLGYGVIESKIYANLGDQRTLAIAKSGKGGQPAMGGGAMLDDDPMGGGGGGLDLDIGGRLDENETLTLAAAKKTPFRLLATGMHVERVSPLRVSRFETEKRVYAPGEPVVATVATQNGGAASLQVAVYDGFGERVTLTEPVTLTMGSSEMRIPLELGELRWGARAELLVRESDDAEPVAVAHTAFAIHENFWAVHQYSFGGPMGYLGKGEKAKASARGFREQGTTVIEALFWAPDDMFDFTPDEEHFLGCQGGYPATITGTRDVIAACHELGLAYTFYANWWGGGGPTAMEEMRRHPEWFANANYHAGGLDDWDIIGFWQDMQPGDEVRAPGTFWAYNQLRLPVDLGAFRKHAAEIVASQKMFGWDAIRYDSAYSASWNVRGLRETRRIVDPELPDFQWGANSFAQGDARAMQMPNLAGGLIMAEGLRLERKKHIGKWLRELSHWRDLAWPYDAHVTPLYQHGDENAPSAVDSVLAVAAHYAGGAHFAGLPETPYGSLSDMSLTHAAMLWDTRLEAPADPAALLTVQGADGLMMPRELVRVADLGEGRYRLIAHFLNVPDDFQMYRGWEVAPPPVHAAAAAAVALPDGAAVSRAVVLDPWAAPGEQVRAVQPDGQGRYPIGPLRYWRVLALDFTAPTPVRVVPNLREQQASYIRDWRVQPLPGEIPHQTDDDKKTLPGHDSLDAALISADPAAGEPLRSAHIPVDLQLAINPTEHDMWSAALARTRVISPDARDATIYLKADDAYALWVNGEKIGAAVTGELQKTDERAYPVQLREGPNDILLKVSNKWLGWEFVLRVGDAEGYVMDDLTVELPE